MMQQCILFLSCAEIIELIHTSVLFFFIIAKVKEEKSYQDLVKQYHQSQKSSKNQLKSKPGSSSKSSSQYFSVRKFILFWASYLPIYPQPLILLLFYLA